MPLTEIQSRIDIAKHELVAALREKWLSGEKLTKDEAIIRFILDCETEQ